MRVFVWQGAKVLGNYRTGMVVVAAMKVEEAWAKLRAADICAFYWLQYGIAYVFDEAGASGIDPADRVWDIPIAPTEYTLDTLPVLAVVGEE